MAEYIFEPDFSTQLGTGRQVSTPQHHLQATVCLAVDPISNFLLSGSTDSNIHVWSIPRLLSFSVASDSNDGQNVLFAPLRSLSNHRAAITAVIFGHSFSNHNIAVSASRDKTCIVWDYANGDALHTFLLASSPLCLALDPADRAVYAGYEDGSVQLMDFYTSGGVVQATHNPTLHSTPIQPPPDTRWLSDPSASAICLQVSYDGTTLLSGHQDGKLQTWDVATGKFSKSLVNFYAPLTNIAMLEPAGFPEALRPKLKLHHVVKPRYESLFNPDNAIPTNYNFTAQFTSTLPLTGSRYDTSFQEALNHSSFPPSLLEGALSEFSTVSNTTDTSQNSAEFSNLRAQNLELSSRLDRAVEIQKKAVSEVQEQEKERWRRLQHEEIKSARKKRRRLRRMRADEIGRKRAMGEITDDSNEEMKREDERHQKPELSSSTEEMTETE